MVSKIKDTTIWGIYILEDQNAWVAANTPGEADLDSLSLGDTYIYFPDPLQFSIQMMSQKEGDELLGWETIQTGSSGTLSGNVYGGARALYIIQAKIDSATGGLIQTLFRKHVQAGDGNKYIIFQTAANTFEPFSTVTGVAKKYAEIIIRKIDIGFKDNAGIDNKFVMIVCEQIGDRN